MPAPSDEAIIAIVTLVIACPPSIAIICHLIWRRRRTSRNDDAEDQDIELASHSNIDLHHGGQDIDLTTRSNFTLQVIQHVKNTVLRSLTTYWST